MNTGCSLHTWLEAKRVILKEFQRVCHSVVVVTYVVFRQGKLRILRLVFLVTISLFSGFCRGIPFVFGVFLVLVRNLGIIPTPFRFLIGVSLFLNRIKDGYDYLYLYLGANAILFVG